MIKETFLPKTGMQKKSFLQDPGYVGSVKGTCYMLHALLYLCMKYEIYMLKLLKEIKIFKQIHKVTFKKSKV